MAVNNKSLAFLAFGLGQFQVVICLRNRFCQSLKSAMQGPSPAAGLTVLFCLIRHNLLPCRCEDFTAGNQFSAFVSLAGDAQSFYPVKRP